MKKSKVIFLALLACAFGASAETENYVGELNGTPYSSLDDMVRDAQNVDAEIVMYTNASFSAYMGVTHTCVIRGRDEQCVISAAGTAGFCVQSGGSLTISNLVFTGYRDADTEDDHGFIFVDGGELTLDDGATLDGMIGNVDRGSGVVDLDKGTATMKLGASIINCCAEGCTDGDGRGGAIYVLGAGCTLNLQGGVISNCYASLYGGGVYTYGYNDDAGINLSGNLTMVDNWSGNYAADDLHVRVASALPGLKLVGDVEGRIGIRYYDSSCNAEGGAFMMNAAGVVAAPAFFNDTDDTLTAVAGENGMLVWAKKIPDDGQCAEELAAAHIYHADGTVQHYTNLVTAIAYMTNGTTARIEMYRGTKGNPNTNLPKYDTVWTSATLPAECCLALTAGEDGYRVRRYLGSELVIPAGTSLTVTNLVMDRRSAGPGTVTNAFLEVNGGALTLADGACISNIIGNTSRDAGAVSVHNGGTFTMRDGAEITCCENRYVGIEESDYKKSDWGVGGAVLLDQATAYLTGGVIRNCLATYGGGGIFACNGSLVYMSGEVRVVDNEDAYGVENNLELADTSRVCLTEEMTGCVCETPKRSTPADLSETNVAAYVSNDWMWDVESLTNSAANFFCDVTGDRGVAVSNGVETIVIWSAALRNGVYTNAAGVGYVKVTDPVSWYVVSTNTPVPLAFSFVACPDAKMVFTVTNLVKDADYSLFRTNSLEGGFGIEGVKPFTNFTAEADGPCQLSFSLDAMPVFWRVVGKETITTNYFNKGK